MGLPRLYKIKEAAAALGGGISVKSLRREVYAGRLRTIRARPGHNSKLLFREDDLLDWLENCAGKRQIVAAPARVTPAVREGRDAA